MGIIIIIIIIVHIQGPVGEFPRIYSGATVLFGFGSEFGFVFFFSFFVGICCVFIFLEAHYLTAAQRWTKNENWPKSRHINHQSTHTHTKTHIAFWGRIIDSAPEDFIVSQWVPNGDDDDGDFSVFY